MWATSAVEKVGFPTVLVILGMWEPLVVTLVAETVLSLTLLTVIAKGHRLEYLGKGLLATPLRYGSLLWDLATLGRFSWDIWIRRDKRWRK